MPMTKNATAILRRPAVSMTVSATILACIFGPNQAFADNLLRTDPAETNGGMAHSDRSPSQHGDTVPISDLADVNDALVHWRLASLRPKFNLYAGDLLDHWGYRSSGAIAARLSDWIALDSNLSDFRALIESAPRDLADAIAIPVELDSNFAGLGEHRGINYGRWSAGASDTLSIEFDLEHASEEMKKDNAFRAALERAGKVWSQRIVDTWQSWERQPGEYKGMTIGDDHGRDGTRIVVGPGGETSTGLVIHVTDADFVEASGKGGANSLRPGDAWEPHTGAVAFDWDKVEEMGEAAVFALMVHEIGHVIGAWLGTEFVQRYAPYTDTASGTWTGPHVVSVHGRPAPFQDNENKYAWYDGERSTAASNFDFAHSGVCTSVMAYCRHSAAVPQFLPTEIDFAFLADLGLTIRPESEQPETYGLAGWMNHSAFTLSVSRHFDVSLAYPQPRYKNYARWQSLDTTDFLWADAYAIGRPSTGNLTSRFPIAGTVRYAGGLIGTAVNYRGLPPVLGDANVSLDLGTLTGMASFTSLEMTFGGERHVFAEGGLHYPISVTDNAILDEVAGVSLAADFYGPRHEEVAGTLEDPRAGLLASFGALHDKRPSYREVVSGADHVKGMVYSSGIDGVADGWSRFRCAGGDVCDVNHEWWKPSSAWSEVNAGENRSSRDRVLQWTAGWGEWLSEDMLADQGAVRIARRYGAATDGGQERYSTDGYVGTMRHAAFGTRMHLVNSLTQQGDAWNDSAYIRGSGFQGDLTGHRPPASASWVGRMIGHQRVGNDEGDPFVQGNALVRVSFDRSVVDIGISDVRSMDGARDVADFGFDDIALSSDGTFFGFDEGTIEGAFFGPAHEEVAGMFGHNGNGILGSFGAVAADTTPSLPILLANSR